MSTLTVGTIAEKVTDAGVSVDGVTLKDGGATLSGDLTIGDASASDRKIVFDGNAQDFHIGLDDSADSLTIGLGSTLGTTSHMVIDATGAITKPLQPAFYVVNTQSNTNIATNNTQVDIKFDTERFDVNSDFNTSTFTFTAPVTGKYQFNVTLNISQIDTASTQYTIRLNTSNRNYLLAIDPEFGSDTLFPFSISTLADMDAGDTAKVTLAQNTGGNQTDVRDDPGSHFSGYLAC